MIKLRSIGKGKLRIFKDGYTNTGNMVNFFSPAASKYYFVFLRHVIFFPKYNYFCNNFKKHQTA